MPRASKVTVASASPASCERRAVERRPSGAGEASAFVVFICETGRWLGYPKRSKLERPCTVVRCSTIERQPHKMRRALVLIGNIALALPGGIFLLFGWERAYYYVDSRLFLPVMTAHYKAVRYRDVDPIRDT